VSILTDAARVVVLCFGGQPRAKLSMMIMRPAAAWARLRQFARLIKVGRGIGLRLGGAKRQREHSRALAILRFPLANSPE
jgi:hypothetical protein